MEAISYNNYYSHYCLSASVSSARHASILPYVHACIAPQNIQYCAYAKCATASKVTYSLNGFHVATALLLHPHSDT